MTRYPINIDTSNWGPFDPGDIYDAMCERERQAFTEYVIKRLRKQPKTGSTDEAIWTGGIMAIVQMIYAQHANQPPDAARDAMHEALDFGWLQVAAMAAAEPLN